MTVVGYIPAAVILSLTTLVLLGVEDEKVTRIFKRL